VIRINGKVRWWVEIQSSRFKVRSSKFVDRGFKVLEMSSELPELLVWMKKVSEFSFFVVKI